MLVQSNGPQMKETITQITIFPMQNKINERINLLSLLKPLGEKYYFLQFV